MKVSIRGDDGVSVTVIISKTTTAFQAVESFCKLRSLSGKAAGIVEPSECVLALETGSGALQCFGDDAIVAEHGFSSKKGGLVIMGFKSQRQSHALADIYSYTARMTMISSVLSRSLQEMGDDSFPDESNLSDIVHSKTEEFLSDMHKLFDASMGKDSKSNDMIVSAKG